MKFLPESFGPGWFSVRNNLHTKETFWGGKFCSLVVPQNPRDGGAWWAAVFGVAQSRTRLKRLSSSSQYTLYTIQSAIQHSDSVIYIYFFLSFLFHSDLPWEIEYSPLCDTVGPCCLSILNVSNSLHLPTPNPQSVPFPPSYLATTSLFSMSVSLFLFCG